MHSLINPDFNASAFARRLGCSRQYIHDVIHGRRRATMAMVKAGIGEAWKLGR